MQQFVINKHMIARKHSNLFSDVFPKGYSLSDKYSGNKLRLIYPVFASSLSLAMDSENARFLQSQKAFSFSLSMVILSHF